MNRLRLLRFRFQFLDPFSIDAIFISTAVISTFTVANANVKEGFGWTTLSGLLPVPRLTKTFGQGEGG
jgi:hypothetical protein